MSTHEMVFDPFFLWLPFDSRALNYFLAQRRHLSNFARMFQNTEKTCSLPKTNNSQTYHSNNVIKRPKLLRISCRHGMDTRTQNRIFRNFISKFSWRRRVVWKWIKKKKEVRNIFPYKSRQRRKMYSLNNKSFQHSGVSNIWYPCQSCRSAE